MYYMVCVFEISIGILQSRKTMELRSRCFFSGAASCVANQSDAGMTVPVAEDTDEV